MYVYYFLIPTVGVITLFFLFFLFSRLLVIDRRFDAFALVISLFSSIPSSLSLSLPCHSNNTARTESPKDARVIDRRIKAAWSQHPHLVVIGNETDFAGKLNKATEAVLTGAKEFFGAAAAGAGEGKGEVEGGKGREGR